MKQKNDPIMDKQIKEIIENLKRTNDGTHFDFIIPGYASKKVRSYIMMRHDFILITEALKRLRSEKDGIIKRCLFYSAVALYGRSFIKSESGFSTLDRRVFNNATEFERTHMELMDRRNKFVAHKERSPDEIAFAYLKLEIDTSLISVQTIHGKRVSPTASQINSYIKIVNYLHDHVMNRLQELADDVWKHLMKTYTPEQMSFMKIAGPTKK